MAALQDLEDMKEFSFSLEGNGRSLISQPFQMPSFFLKGGQAPVSPSNSLASSAVATGSSGNPSPAVAVVAETVAEQSCNDMQNGSPSLGSSPVAAGPRQQQRPQQQQEEEKEQQQLRRGAARGLPRQEQEQQLGSEGQIMNALTATASGTVGTRAAAGAGAQKGAGAGPQGDEENRADQEQLPPGYGGVFCSIWGH
jgi:hypothetical protein